MKQKRDELVTSRTEKGKKIAGATREKQILPNLQRKVHRRAKTVSNLLPFIILGTILSPKGARRACKS